MPCIYAVPGQHVTSLPLSQSLARDPGACSSTGAALSNRGQGVGSSHPGSTGPRATRPPGRNKACGSTGGFDPFSSPSQGPPPPVSQDPKPRHPSSALARDGAVDALRLPDALWKQHAGQGTTARRIATARKESGKTIAELPLNPETPFLLQQRYLLCSHRHAPDRADTGSNTLPSLHAPPWYRTTRSPAWRPLSQPGSASAGNIYLLPGRPGALRAQKSFPPEGARYLVQCRASRPLVYGTCLRNVSRALPNRREVIYKIVQSVHTTNKVNERSRQLALSPQPWGEEEDGHRRNLPSRSTELPRTTKEGCWSEKCDPRKRDDLYLVSF